MKEYRRNRLMKPLGILLISIFCLLPIFYLFIFRFGDYYLSRIIANLKVEGTVGVLNVQENYDSKIFLGMEENELIQEIEGVGVIKSISHEVDWGGNTIETINISLGIHPSNNFLLFATFNPDGNLIFYKYHDD